MWRPILCSEFQTPSLSAHRKGFTFLEIMVVLGIIGIMAVIFYPNIMKTLERRDLENTAREILTTLQRAKFESVKSRLNTRVRFENTSGNWVYTIEREDSANQWNLISGFIRKSVSSSFVLTLDLGGLTVEFSPLGIVENYDSSHHSITLRNTKLVGTDPNDQRVLNIYAGGSIQYSKSQSQPQGSL